jgi:hypothetical protein
LPSVGCDGDGAEGWIGQGWLVDNLTLIFRVLRQKLGVDIRVQTVAYVKVGISQNDWL